MTRAELSALLGGDLPIELGEPRPRKGTLCGVATFALYRISCPH